MKLLTITSIIFLYFEFFHFFRAVTSFLSAMCLIFFASSALFSFAIFSGSVQNHKIILATALLYFTMLAFFITLKFLFCAFSFRYFLAGYCNCHALSDNIKLCTLNHFIVNKVTLLTARTNRKFTQRSIERERKVAKEKEQSRNEWKPHFSSRFFFCSSFLITSLHN